MQRGARLQEECRELSARLKQPAHAQMTEERRARQEKLAAATQKLHSLVDALSMWESYE